MQHSKNGERKQASPDAKLNAATRSKFRAAFKKNFINALNALPDGQLPEKLQKLVAPTRKSKKQKANEANALNKIGTFTQILVKAIYECYSKALTATIYAVKRNNGDLYNQEEQDAIWTYGPVNIIGASFSNSLARFLEESALADTVYDSFLSLFKQAFIEALSACWIYIDSPLLISVFGEQYYVEEETQATCAKIKKMVKKTCDDHIAEANIHQKKKAICVNGKVNAFIFNKLLADISKTLNRYDACIVLRREINKARRLASKSRAAAYK